MDQPAKSSRDATNSPLPYRDVKAHGAPDFYYAINATFRFILAQLGQEGWVRYLEDLGRDYFKPVNEQWRSGGLGAVAVYWKAFFDAEPGAKVEVRRFDAPDRVVLDLQVCPAIAHLRAGGREIVREFCQHCYHLGDSRAQAAGMALRLEGGNGTCRHVYHDSAEGLAPQDMSRIKEAC